MRYLFDEGNEWLRPEPKHFVVDRRTRREKILSQTGEVAGFRPGDRIEYTDECYPSLRGLHATIVGFDSEKTIWTQTDGYGTSCHSTPAKFARIAFKKL